MQVFAVAAGAFCCALPAMAIAADDPTVLMQSVEESLEGGQILPRQKLRQSGRLTRRGERDVRDPYRSPGSRRYSP